MVPVTGEFSPLPAPAPPHQPCPGSVMWRTATGPDVCTCTRAGGHPGDHRDAAGYAWNDERWLD